MPRKIDYAPFMAWLQQNYPELYITAWNIIQIPDKGRGFNLLVNPGEPLYERIVQAVQEYKTVNGLTAF